MKHRAIFGIFRSLLIVGAFAVAGGRGTPPANGEDTQVSQRGGTARRLGVRLRAGDRSAVMPSRKSAIPAGAPTAKRDTSSLREIEKRVLPLPIVQGPNRYDGLPDFYWAENPLLRDRLELAQAAFDGKPTPKFRALTLVAGAAGVGKTFIKGKVFDKDHPRTATCKFDIRELYDEWAECGITADKADLASGDLVISRLKSVTDKSKPRLREYLEARNAAFYVVDSLGEIHPDDYVWVLEQIEEFVFHGDRQFVHVAVFGRGFAFRDFWNEQADRRDQVDVKLYSLDPPSFRTTGDLMVSSWNYHSWKYKLAWAPDGGEAGGMSLDDYGRWRKSGFSREGSFRSIACETNDDMRADVQNALFARASDSPVVCSVLHNLAGNSLIREILRKETLERRSYDERRIMTAYLDAWLVRETKVHDRPSVEKPEHLDLYLSLLGQVAVKYSRQGRIDGRGRLSVGDDDTVAVQCAGRQRAFPVKRILERSGLIVADPREAGVAKYRFEPAWFHRLLVETHNERMAQGQRLSAGPGAE